MEEILDKIENSVAMIREVLELLYDANTLCCKKVDRYSDIKELRAFAENQSKIDRAFSMSQYVFKNELMKIDEIIENSTITA